MRRGAPSRPAGVSAIGLCVALVAGCSSGQPVAATNGSTSPPAVATSSSTTPPTTSPPTTTPPTTAAPPVAEAGWKVVSETPTTIVADQRTFVGAGGSHVVVARFHAGTFGLDLHDGSEDPPARNATIPATGASTVSTTERPALLGAFNGGFKASTGVGGFEVDGRVLSPLVPGLASVAIDANGVPTVGIWGTNVPRPGQQIVSVRQNLPPLVEAGRPSPTVNQVSSWGATIKGLTSVARSALGEDGKGNLLFAGSSSAAPADVANALVTAGATTAMELDINPEWVQLDLAATPGGALQAAIAGQSRPADQYLSGWIRDFFVVVGKTR